MVDDERAIREVCREVAQSLGFNSVVADSAEHAYRALETQALKRRAILGRPSGRIGLMLL
jgi:CheY-like chemotaxis protein